MEADNRKQQPWFRALDHARLTGVKPTYNIAGDFYHVLSPRTGQRYIQHRHVHGERISWTCTCPAAMAGYVCWHRALVMALPYERALRAK